MIDIAIIGGGPAGLSAGIYAARGGASTVLFEEIFPGGQAARTDRIDNYPGFPEGIDGNEIGMRMEQQAKRFGLTVRYQAATKLELEGEIKRIHTAGGVEEARTVILCPGADPKKLGLAGEEALIGKGISYCATCDGAFFRGMDVAIAGGGDTALADALYLARFAGKIYLIHRRDALRGAKSLQTAVFNEPRIELVWSSVVKELHSTDVLIGLSVQDVNTKEIRSLPVSALFVAVGTTPRTELLRGLVTLDEAGRIITDQLLRTSVSGVFAAGDARDTPLRQVITAAADGALAATQALEYLN